MCYVCDGLTAVLYIIRVNCLVCARMCSLEEVYIIKFSIVMCLALLIRSFLVFWLKLDLSHFYCWVCVLVVCVCTHVVVLGLYVSCLCSLCGWCSGCGYCYACGVYVSMLREWDGASVAILLVWGRGSEVAVSAGHEYVGGTRGSGIVSSATDMLWLSCSAWKWRVGGVCEMCMCLARGGVGGEAWFLLHLIDICFLPCIVCGRYRKYRLVFVWLSDID